ncbi:hypothetical protein [Yoonia sp. BS5-3]|uniref:AcrB/AcrD/AcrF family protein n=1 Tax=Yoonia phaeophyticola TaxID=3137369 RepID=A0ABZ3IEC5_9RHOB
MSESAVLRVLRERPFQIVLALVLIMVLIEAIFYSTQAFANFAKQGNDDIMRLLSVRDWLAGQGWYDVAQYRAVPPEGVSLHWSRYLDLGIAAIILPLSWFLPMPTAEVLAAVIWPTFVMMLNLMVIGFATRRLFGVPAACFALLCTALWPVTGDLHSGGGNLDHHNVQMLTMTLMALAVVWPDRPVFAGIVGGFSAAFSLAIGLESLPFVIVIGTVVLLRVILDGTALTRQLLVSFCLTLGLSAIVLWLGQAAPASRLQPICDQLGTPTLALVWIAAGASVLPLAFGPVFRRPVVHLAITAILTAIGIFAAWELVSPCLDGPYANLPPVLQEFISGRIIEARPGLDYAISRPAPFVTFVLPVFVTTLAGFAILASHRREQRNTTALFGLLFVCLAGIAMIFVQMRTVIMAASVVPILAGYVLACLLDRYLKGRKPISALLLLVFSTAVMSPGQFAAAIRPFVPVTDRSALTQAADCRTYDALIALNEAPPGLILNNFNFGPSLLWATHHDVLSVSYHRSAAAMRNSIVPFELEAAEMETFVKDSGATYLLLCKGYQYRGAPARALADGGTVDWLRPVPLSDENQLLFEVLR